jgi:hypothetical protein
VLKGRRIGELDPALLLAGLQHGDMVDARAVGAERIEPRANGVGETVLG